MTPIYLDANANTAIDPEVLEAMKPLWLRPGNPQSRHAFGRAARKPWDRARESIAAALGASFDEVLITSGGTEANRLAISALARHAPRSKSPNIITSHLEHPAVTQPLDSLDQQGIRQVLVPIQPNGTIDPQVAAAAADSHTLAAILMLANNETGAIQPVEYLAALLNPREIPVHTDASQAVGRIPVDFHALGVASLAASAHKFHGPLGVGCLLVRQHSAIHSHLAGKHQDSHQHPGTPPVALAVGMAAALDRWTRLQSSLISHWATLRDDFESRIQAALGPNRVVRHGPDSPQLRLPQTSCLGFPTLQGDALLIQLDRRGVAASIGAACASGSTRASATLLAMGVPETLARASIRFSFDQSITPDQIAEAAQRVVSAVEALDAFHSDLAQPMKNPA